MGEPLPSELTRTPVSQKTEAIKTPPPKESPVDRDGIISRLKRISEAVSSAHSEQKAENPFNRQVEGLIQLGNNYVSYLEAHSQEITDNKIFQAVAGLAKSSIMMNIEQYAVTIRGIGDYVNQHPLLNELNPPGKKDGPWANIKETLYFTKNNDSREQFRERILAKAQLLITAGDFSPRHVDHFERFFTDPKGRLPSEFIPGYIEEHAADLQQWLPLKLEGFEKFIADRVGDFNGKMSENPILKQVDEEIASIKQKNIQESKALAKVQFPDREKKLAFIRDLRFGRVTLQKVGIFAPRA